MGSTPESLGDASRTDGSWIVSVKGVLTVRNHVALAKNCRDEWELPGGRLDLNDESPEAAVVREFAEELGIEVRVTQLLDTYVFEPVPGEPRLIITYRCETDGLPELRCSDEHDDVAWIAVDALHEISLPEGYWRSITSFSG